MRNVWSDLLTLLPGRLALTGLAVSVLMSAVLVALGPAYVQVVSLVPSMGRLLVVTALIGLLLWRPGLQHRVAYRLVAVLCGIAFLLVAWDAIRVLNHTSMTLDFPLSDDLLDGWDKALGLDWPGYFSLVASRPWLRDAMAWSYTSLTSLSVLSYMMMALLLDIRRSIYFLETFTLTAVFCTIVGAVFPARAAVDRYFGQSGDFSAFPVEPGLYHLSSLERLRDGGAVELVVGQLPGLVTFPSFHTAAGILLVAATWRTRLVVPALLYAIVMIASTPVFGGHYFVDLIAGAAVALVIAVALARLPRFRPVFELPPPAEVSCPVRVPRA